jgi:transcriptional regulator with XRE-family HTH domain
MGVITDHPDAAPRVVDSGQTAEQRVTEVERHVGSRLRLRRIWLGMSQEQLGAALGVSFQQIQKYERGTNRIGAGRLFEMTRVLNVPIGYFFDGAPHPPKSTEEDGAPHAGAELAADVMNEPEALALVRAFARITAPEIRKQVLGLLRSLAQEA